MLNRKNSLINFYKNFEKQNLIKITLPLACILVSFFYGLAYTSNNIILRNISSIVFIACILTIGGAGYKLIEKASEAVSNLIIQIFCINLALAISIMIFKGNYNLFWPDDAIRVHIPTSILFTEFFQGKISSNQLPNVVGVLTHSLTGLSFLIFGQSPFSTVIVQTILKITAIVFIFKAAKIFDLNSSKLAPFLYAYCPTVFFYNIVFYKESVIHALMAILLFMQLKIIKEKFSWLIPLFLIFLVILLYERYYLFYFYIIQMPFSLLFLRPKSKYTSVSIFFSAILLASILIYKIRPDLLSTIYYTLIDIRNRWSIFGDVLNKYNYNVPYLIAFIKITFTPFFTFNKFIIFTDFSTLLIWGSIINQLIIFSSIAGLLKLLKISISHLYYWIPFIVFLLVFAFISPWSGRVRDSFYPLIVCYSAYFITSNRFTKKFLKL